MAILWPPSHSYRQHHSGPVCPSVENPDLVLQKIGYSHSPTHHYLALVLYPLAKAPLEPTKEASLKHFTFKTVFLLTLGSGKCRSETHAWRNKNIKHQSDWSKVSLYPSLSFLSKNQLAKEGPDSVAPVVIPALAPTQDNSLKSDRSLWSG